LLTKKQTTSKHELRFDRYNSIHQYRVYTANNCIKDML